MISQASSLSQEDDIFIGTRGEQAQLWRTDQKRKCRAKRCTTILEPHNKGPYCRCCEKTRRLSRIFSTPQKKLKRVPTKVGVCRVDNRGIVSKNDYRGRDSDLGSLRNYQSKIDTAEAYGYQSYVEAILGLYEKHRSTPYLGMIFEMSKDQIGVHLKKLGVRLDRRKQ